MHDRTPVRANSKEQLHFSVKRSLSLLLHLQQYSEDLSGECLRAK